MAMSYTFFLFHMHDVWMDVDINDIILLSFCIMLFQQAANLAVNQQEIFKVCFQALLESLQHSLFLGL